MTLIYLLVGLDRDLTYSLRIEDFDFKRRIIMLNITLYNGKYNKLNQNK